MSLVPKRVEYRREFRGKTCGAVKGGKTIAFGEHGLMALESHWIINRQIEAARVAMTRYMRRGGKVRIRIFPHRPYTAEGVGVHIGSGKGVPIGWVVIVKREKIMFETGGVLEEAVRRALRLASIKLPIKCKFVAKSTEVGDGSNES